MPAKGRIQRSTKAQMHTASLCFRWVELVAVDKLTSREALKKVSEETGIGVPRLAKLADNERWHDLSQKILPAMRCLEPTTTTAIEVLDSERKRHLAISHKLADGIVEQIDYVREQFKAAKENDNHILASEMVDTFGKLALAATRVQSIAQSATCDSGAATAITETANNPAQGNAMNFYIRPLMAKPRIPQIGAPIIEFQPLPVEPEKNGTSN